MLDAVLELEVLARLAGDVGVERLRERRAVIGVDAAEPLPAGGAELGLGVAEHLLEARGVEDRVRADVPVPDTVVGAAQRQRVALLGGREALQHALVHQRVADRVLEPVGAQPRDEQEVGDARFRRLGVRDAVGPVAEHDHGRRGRVPDELLRELEPVGPGRVDLAVDEHDVVRVDPRERLVLRGDVGHLGRVAREDLQQRTDRSVADRVGRDREDLRHAAAGGSSAASSQ